MSTIKCSYVLFHSIEFEVRRHLKQLPLEKGFTKKYVMEEVLNDVDVQYHWSSIASDIDEMAAQMLLKDAVVHQERRTRLQKRLLDSERA